MTNLLPGEKNYNVLGCILGMCLTISIASCGGNQQSSFKPQKDKIENSSSSICDKVSDTIFMNFHSNMKQEDFDKEISQNPKLKYGKSIIGFNNRNIEFTITPTFSSCLTSVTLDSEIQFGNYETNDSSEVQFCNYIKNLLEKKYGSLCIEADSTYYEPEINDYFSEYDIQIDMNVLGLDRETVIGDFKKNGKTRLVKISDWVRQYTYSGQTSRLDEKGNVKKHFYIMGAKVKYEDLSPREIEDEKRKPIDKLKSAKYKSYFTSNKDLQLVIVTSYYTHQDHFGDEKQRTQRSRVLINYYSDRYWSEKKFEPEKKIEQKKIEKIKNDSLIKVNQDRL
jgi:hypothetical protein